MPKRSKSWDEILEKKLRDAEFARNYLDAAVEDGIPLNVALGEAIRAMGVVEYAKKVGVAPPNIQKLVSKAGNPTLKTMNKLLKPLGLRLGLMAETKKHRRSRAA